MEATTSNVSEKYAGRQTVRIRSRELSDAIKEKGYTLHGLTFDHGLPCGKSYLSKSLIMGRMNPDILQLICIILDKSPSDFLVSEQAKPKNTAMKIQVITINRAPTQQLDMGKMESRTAS